MTKILGSFFLVLLIASPLAFAGKVNLNSELKSAMSAFYVPVAGIAIIDDWKIQKAFAVSSDKRIQASNDSLFQAASISKSVTAYAALKLASEGKIIVNESANKYLKGWKIPNSKYNKKHPVKVLNLMDMTSGLSVSGFQGYSKSRSVPTSIQLLNGSGPANNQPIKPFYIPGTKYFYSGGAFQVLQHVISSVTGKPFNKWMNDNVLKKLNMKHSIFQYPLNDKAYLKKAIPGFVGWGQPKEIPGGWHNYKCSGACGLWSTPSDLALFAINISKSLNGKGLIKSSLAHEMLSRKPNTDFGLGVVVNGEGKSLYFWKAGHNLGYHSLMIMFPNIGKGLVIMTDSESGDSLIRYMTAIIAKKYNWPYYFPFFDELIKTPFYKN